MIKQPSWHWLGAGLGTAAEPTEQCTVCDLPKYQRRHKRENSWVKERL